MKKKIRTGKSNMSRTEALATAPLLPLMLSVGIPNFVAQMVNLLYNIVDRVYIGHIAGTGSLALTGVGLCFPILTFVSAFSNFAGAGGAPLAGIALGEGNKEKAGKIQGNGCFLLIVLAVILTIVFQIIKKPFLFAFGASDATYIYAQQYLTIYLWGTIFVMLSLGLNTYILIQGESMVAMGSILIGAVLNIALDPVFIFALHMGVRGAALATIISQAVSSIWILRFLTSERPSVPLTRSALKPEGKIIRDIAALGVSPFIMGATESLITVVFNRGAQLYGNDLYVGSITILQSVLQIIFVPLNGFTLGVQSVISYNYGAGNIRRVKQTCVRLLIITGCYCFLLSGLFMLFPGAVSGLFTNDADLLAICEKMLPIFLAGMLIFGLQCGSQNSFVALGMAKQSLFFALLRKVILLTPLALILPKVMNSVAGIYYAEPISDAASAICCFTTLLVVLRHLDERYARKHSQTQA